jgi:hypothetical protein
LSRAAFFKVDLRMPQSRARILEISRLHSENEDASALELDWRDLLSARRLGRRATSCWMTQRRSSATCTKEPTKGRGAAVFIFDEKQVHQLTAIAGDIGMRHG